MRLIVYEVHGNLPRIWVAGERGVISEALSLGVGLK